MATANGHPAGQIAMAHSIVVIVLRFAACALTAQILNGGYSSRSADWASRRRLRKPCYGDPPCRPWAIARGERRDDRPPPRDFTRANSSFQPHPDASAAEINEI